MKKLMWVCWGLLSGVLAACGAGGSASGGSAGPVQGISMPSQVSAVTAQ